MRLTRRVSAGQESEDKSQADRLVRRTEIVVEREFVAFAEGSAPAGAEEPATRRCPTCGQVIPQSIAS